MHQSSFHIITRFKELVVKHYPNGIINVLDVGSYGVNGTFKELFSDSTRFNYVGLDVTAGPNVDYVPKDPYAWQGLADDSFDVMISGQAFEHIEFPWLIIEEMNRTLKPNGLICIIAPSRGPEHKYPVDCWRYYPDGFRALAKWVGLEVQEAKTFWGSTGFTDGSDQWGDTLCILRKPATSDRPIKREHKKPPASHARNSYNPLRSSKKESYYGFARNEVIETLKKCDITPGRVLEIGCAGGATGKNLKEQLQVSHYVGVELSPEAAEVARHYLDNVIVADIEAVDLKAAHGLQYGEFDLLIALDVLEHLYDPWDALAELTQYVKDGGYIVASIPNIQNITVIRGLIKGKWEYVDAGLLDATHIRFFTLEEARKMFSGAGLAIERTDCVLNPPVDLEKTADSNNRIVDEKTSISGLTRDELLHLHTYQYIVVAKKARGIRSSGKSAMEKIVSEQKGPVAPSPALARKKVTPGLVSIVILAFNQQKYTKECVESIRKHTPEDHEIIFVDNGSTDGTVKWLKTLVKEHSAYRLIENSENLGFAKGCNQGIEASQGEYILLLNNDVVVTEHWLSGMLECLNTNADIGIVGPMTNNISGPQRVEQAGYTAMSGLDAYARQFRERNRHRRIPLRRIVGFCMLFRRTLAEQIGLLDESFGSGNFEDDDYCLRSALFGHQNIVAGDVFIHHYGSRSFIGNRINYGSSLSGNRLIFTGKWNNIDATSTLGKRLVVVNAQERARDLYYQGKTDKAFETLLEGLKHAPEEKSLYVALAELLLDNKQFKEAVDLLSALPQDGSSQTLQLQIGYAMDGLGLHEEAGQCAERALMLHASSASALNLKGLLAYKHGDQEAAADFFNKAITADPGYGEPHANLAFLLWAADKKEEALNLFERGFILSPNDADIVAAYHTAITEMKEFQRAEKIFVETLAARPTYRKIIFLYIDVLIQQEKHDVAMQKIEQAMILFGVDDGLLSAALDIRSKVGPQGIPLSSRRKATLSLCMIVKDEELNIAKCLMSVKPVVDEMIVVDTGSKDRTKDIATAFGARVYDFPWTSDFSEARNISLAKASGDWILVLDADEVVSAMDHAEVVRLIAKPGKGGTAYSFVTRNYVTPVNNTGWTANDGKYSSEEAGTGWFPSTKVRLFPRSSLVRFVNPVHELVEPALIKNGYKLKNTGVPIHHYGKLDQEKTLSKGEEYYQLGKKKLAKSEVDPAAVRELAIQAGELKKFDEAVELWQQAIKLNADVAAAYFNLVAIYVQMDKFSEALEASEKAVALRPDAKEVVCNHALCEIYAGDAAQAVVVLEALIKTTPQYPLAQTLLAVAYVLAGEAEKGMKIFHSLRIQGSGLAATIYPFAQKLITAGRTTQARVLVDWALENNAIHNDLVALRAKCSPLSDSSINSANF